MDFGLAEAFWNSGWGSTLLPIPQGIQLNLETCVESPLNTVGARDLEVSPSILQCLQSSRKQKKSIASVA